VVSVVLLVFTFMLISSHLSQMLCAPSPQFEALLTDVYHGPPPKTEVTRLMTHFDANKDGKVTMDEFVEGVKQLKGVCRSSHGEL
jgi:Ca2+-binding EF-hand superfamily protein